MSLLGATKNKIINIPCTRDKLVAAATAGQTSFDGVTYSTTAEAITGLMAAGSTGVNHGT